MVTKLVKNPYVAKPRVPKQATIDKSVPKIIAKLAVKALPKKGTGTKRQQEARKTEELRALMHRRLQQDAENPRAAKARKAKEAAKLAKLELLTTPIDKYAYSEPLGSAICERLSNGEHLTDVLKSLDVQFSVFSQWMSKNKPFAAMFAAAREANTHMFVSQIISIADNATGKGELEKIRIATRQWLATKILNKVYGEKVTHAGEEGSTAVIQLVASSEELLNKVRGSK